MWRIRESNPCPNSFAENVNSDSLSSKNFTPAKVKEQYIPCQVFCKKNYVGCSIRLTEYRFDSPGSLFLSVTVNACPLMGSPFIQFFNVAGKPALLGISTNKNPSSSRKLICGILVCIPNGKVGDFFTTISPYSGHFQLAVSAFILNLR